MKNTRISSIVNIHNVVSIAVTAKTYNILLLSRKKMADGGGVDWFEYHIVVVYVFYSIHSTVLILNQESYFTAWC